MLWEENRRGCEICCFKLSNQAGIPEKVRLEQGFEGRRELSQCVSQGRVSRQRGLCQLRQIRGAVRKPVWQGGVHGGGRCRVGGQRCDGRYVFWSW